MGGFFYYSSWESVKNLQFYCGRIDFKQLYVKRKLTFLCALCDLGNCSYAFLCVQTVTGIL